MFFALLISVGSLLLFLVPLKYIYNLRYFIGIVIGAVAFKGKENKLLSISILYLLNLCFVGTLVVFRIDNYTLLFISSLLVILIYSIQFIMKKMINNKSFEYNVLICDKSYVGYFDSGNKAIYQGKPIIFINNNYYNDSFTYVGKTLINTIDKVSEILVYSGPSIYINEKEYQVFFSFVSIKEDLILNYYLEGIC